MQVASPGASCFGKLPSRGDFVRANAGGRAMREFDAWVQRGLVEARHRLGPSLAAAFEASGAQCFFAEVPNTPHALAGALRPSRDRSGRRYPFLVAVEVDKRSLEGRRIPSWPDRYAAFYAAAVTLVDDAVEGGLDADDLEGALRSLQAVYDATPFPVDYEFRLRQARACDLWNRTWGDAEDGRKYVLLKNLTEAFARSSGGRPGRWPAPFRLPLPHPPRGLDVSFWLETCWCLAGGTPDAPAYFWSPSDEEGGGLLLVPGPIPVGVFVHLLDGATPSRSDVRDFSDANGQPAALAALALSPQVGTLLEDDAVSLHTFIHRVRA